MKPALALMVVAAFAAAPAFSAFRCGSKLVSEGATRSEVAAKCGDPTEIVTQKSLWRRPVIWTAGRPYFIGEELVEVEVEAWIYNLGPNKLMRRLRFEDGVVAQIETLGYGYNE